MKKLIRRQVFINEAQFLFMPGRRTADAICLLKQFQFKYLGKKKRICTLHFFDLEKAFDQFSREVIWEALKN